MSAEKTAQLKITGWRLWLFRIVAVIVIPILLFLTAEVILRIVGYGYPPEAIVKCKSQGGNAYCDNVKFAWRFFPRHIAREFEPFVFSADKPDKTYRVFVLGESAAAGTPDAAFCFGRILQVMLRQKYPQENSEVITAAMPAINSHVVLEIAKDCARHQPDLFIVYLGNNEVVGPYGPGTIFGRFSANLRLIRLAIAIKATKLGQLLTNLFEVVSTGRNRPADWRGMEMFLGKQVRADDPAKTVPDLDIVYRHFQRNLQDILKLSCNSKTKIIFCTVASNLKDNPPFASLHRLNLTESDKQKWDEIYQRGIKYESAGDYIKAIEQYLSAAQIDDGFADLQFRLGRCYWAIGEYDKAKKEYIRARDLDTLRFRADTKINEIIRHTAGNRTADGVYLVDTVKIFESKSPHETPGEEIFYEHVHMNFNGNYTLAKAVFKQVEEILPERIKRHETDERLLPTEAECAQHLAYTDWDRYKIAEKILNDYIKQAPFTNQLYHEVRVERMGKKLKELKANLTPDAMEKSAAQYRSAIQNDSNDWRLHYKYGELLAADLNNYRAAAEQLGLALEYVDYYVAYTNLAMVLASLGNFDGAIAHNLNALRINPTFSDAHYNLGRIYQVRGRLDKAAEHYSKAIQFAADYVPAYLRLGVILYQQGKINKAVKLYHKGVLVAPNNELMHYNLGCLLAKQGHKQEAIEELRTALQIEPNSVETRTELEKLLNKRY